jgi:hypothetical protein
MAVPVGLPPSGRPQGDAILYRRRANYVWTVEEGVPPVIEGIPDEAVIPSRPSARQEEAFKEWFAELAYPWRTGRANPPSEPQVILRRVGT